MAACSTDPTESLNASKQSTKPAQHNARNITPRVANFLIEADLFSFVSCDGYTHSKPPLQVQWVGTESPRGYTETDDFLPCRSSCSLCEKVEECCIYDYRCMVASLCSVRVSLTCRIRGSRREKMSKQQFVETLCRAQLHPFNAREHNIIRVKVPYHVRKGLPGTVQKVTR